MSEWRITIETLLRNDVSGLDHERCAALHNLIIERGWTESGRNLNDLDSRTWWECFGKDAELRLERDATRSGPTPVCISQGSLAWLCNLATDTWFLPLSCPALFITQNVGEH